MSGIKFLTLGDHGPDDSDVLVCKGDGCNILVSPPNQTHEPRVFSCLVSAKRMTERAS